MPLFDYKCQFTTAPLALAASTTVISVILSLTSIVGNVLIILAVVLDPNKNLRRPFSWLIVNLAAADLISGAIANPTTASFHFKMCLGKKPNAGESIVLSTSFLVSSTASALTIASLAFERYLSVRKPNTYRNTVTNKRIIFTVVAIWVVSIASLIMYSRLGFVLSSFINVNASLLLAAFLSCFMYFLMWRKLRERPQVNHNRRVVSYSSSQLETPQSSHADRTSSNPVVASKNVMQDKVSEMFLVVLVVMLCSYGLSALFTYLLVLCKSCSCVAQHSFLDFGSIFVSINSCLNFFCYAMQSSRFRSAFIKILKIKKNSRCNQTRFSHVTTTRETVFLNVALELGENIQMNSVCVETLSSATGH